MSIAENHGGLYQNLKALRDSDGKAECNFFRALGLDYLYVRDGNDVAALIEVFNRVKNTPRPTVVHIHTLKGRGYALAEADRERFYWGMPFDLATGAPKSEAGAAEDYGDLTGRFLLERMAKDPTLVAITSGTPAVMGFTPERRKQAGTSVCRRRHCRRACRCTGIRDRGQRRTSRLRGLQYVYPALLRSVVPGFVHQRESCRDTGFYGDDSGHERCDAPRIFRYSAHQ